MNIPGEPASAQIAVPPPPVPAAGGGFQPFGEDGISFFDLLDVINPLQHIPVVSTLYRELTGDTIDPAPRVAGGAVFGGALGAVAGLLNVILQEATGKDVGEHVLAFFQDDEPAEGETMVAETVPEEEFVTAAGGGTVPSHGADDDALVMPLMPAPVEREILPPPPPPAQANAPTSPLVFFDPQPATSPSLVTAALRQAELESDALRAVDLSSARRTPPAGEGSPDDGVVTGAVAPTGGWFTEAMLEALAKYREGARPTAAPPAASSGGA